MGNKDLTLGGKSQVKGLQIECFLDAHVPSSQTNKMTLLTLFWIQAPHTQQQVHHLFIWFILFMLIGFL